MNAIFRIGSDLAARFPLTAQDPDDARIWLMAEAEAARESAPATGLGARVVRRLKGSRA